jgi:hypothetical protein
MTTNAISDREGRAVNLFVFTTGHKSQKFDGALKRQTMEARQIQPNPQYHSSAS